MSFPSAEIRLEIFAADLATGPFKPSILEPTTYLLQAAEYFIFARHEGRIHEDTVTPVWAVLALNPRGFEGITNEELRRAWMAKRVSIIESRFSELGIMEVSWATDSEDATDNEEDPC